MNALDASRQGMVGRQAELRLLFDRWRRCLHDGRGGLLLLGGEAGIGKSRLAAALVAQVARDGGETLTLRCSADFRYSALLPLVRRLRRDIGLLPVQPVEEAQQLLRRWVADEHFDAQEDLPLLACLLGVRLPEGERIAHLSATQRARAHELLVGWLLHRAARQPLLLLVEDLHWADPSTLEVLGLLREQASLARATRLLLLGTHRTEFQPPWPAERFSALLLGRFDLREVEALLLGQGGGKRLPDGLAQAVLHRTDGVPLHVEEVLRLFADCGALRDVGASLTLSAPLDALPWPRSLSDSVQQRLSLHRAGREVACLAACVGREFGENFIEQLWSGHAARLREGLQELLAAGLLLRQVSAQRVVLVFKHARVQEAAYAMLGEAERRRHHARIAELLATQFAASAEPERLAHHHIGAGAPALALPLLLAAADHALQTSAHAEAAAHLHRALGLVAELPEAERPHRDEAALHIRLGAALAALRGYADEGAGQAYAQAMQLTAESAEQALQAQYGLWRYHFMRAEYTRALALAEALLARASRLGNEEFRLLGQRALTSTLFYLGRYPEALRASAQLLGAQASADLRRQALRHDVVDAWVTTHAYRAWIAWLTGDEPTALRDMDTALSAARAMQHPFSLALALSFAAWLHQFRGDLAALRDCAQQAQQLSQSHGFSFWLGWNEALQGWSVAVGGAPRQGAEQIAAGTARWTGTGSRLGLSFFLGLRAQALLRAQQVEAAARVLDEAERFVQDTGECFWQPELLRLRAQQLGAARAPAAQRDACLQQAAALALVQQAQALALRCERTRANGDV